MAAIITSEVGKLLLRNLKKELMITVEGLGLPKGQESAIKTTIIHKLYNNYGEFKEFMSDTVQYEDLIKYKGKVGELESKNKSVKRGE